MMGKRLGSKWRAKQFKAAWLLQEGRCSQCRAEERMYYARSGYGGSLIFGNWHTQVHLRSSLELDHIVPLAWGGSNDDGNLQLLCRDCHREKTTSERHGRRAA